MAMATMIPEMNIMFVSFRYSLPTSSVVIMPANCNCRMGFLYLIIRPVNPFFCSMYIPKIGKRATGMSDVMARGRASVTQYDATMSKTQAHLNI